MNDISNMTREQLLEHIIYLQKKLLFLKEDEPVQSPPFVPPYYNPLYPEVNSQKPQCPKCKMRLDQVMGYVCGDVNCPTFMRVTSNTHMDSR